MTTPEERPKNRGGCDGVTNSFEMLVSPDDYDEIEKKGRSKVREFMKRKRATGFDEGEESFDET
jgi:hypothetical protein